MSQLSGNEDKSPLVKVRTAFFHFSQTRYFQLVLATLLIFGLSILYHATISLKEFHTYRTGNVIIRNEPQKAKGAFSTIETCLKECTEQLNDLCTAARFKCLLEAFPYKSADGTGTVTPVSDVWWGVPLDKFPGTKDQPLPSMIEDDCIVHVLLGASVGNPQMEVAVVEMGTFLGAASVCTAAGLALAKSKVHYHAFEFFKFQGVKDSNFKKLYIAEDVPAISKLMASDDLDYEKIWNAVVTNVYPSRLVHSHAGYIGTEVAKTPTDWDNFPVGLFIIDSAKPYDALVRQSHAAWLSFRPGSVVVFADFTYHVVCNKAGRQTVPGFVYSQLVETGLFRLLLDFPSTSEVAFEVTDKYDPTKGKQYLKSYKRGDVDWKSLSVKMINEFKALHQSRGYDEKRIGRVTRLMECDMKYAARYKTRMSGV